MKFAPTMFVLLLAGCASAPREADPAPSPPPVATTERIAPADLQASIQTADAEVVVLDVRTPEEFAAGHVPGARNIPHDQLAARVAELGAARDKPVVLYCRTGRRSALAAETLRAAGFSRLLHLEGDYPGWTTAGLPVDGAASPSADR